MIWRVEIKEQAGVVDSVGEGLLKDIQDCGIRGIKRVNVFPVYLVDGELDYGQIERIARDLFVDPVIENYLIEPASEVRFQETTEEKIIEIAYNPGVMDPVEASTLKGIRDLGIQGVRSIRTAKKYVLAGRINKKELRIIIGKVLSNKLIQYQIDLQKKDRYQFSLGCSPRGWKLKHVDLLQAGDRKLKEISRRGQLFLNLDEMKAIQKYFKKIKRDPTDCELETIAQTWSEHCHHKTFRGNIQYTVKENGRIKKKMIRNLLKSTIMKATQKINKSWCVSVFHDNAGVIEFDRKNHVCFKVETHNHPSALEPFGGANTGIGGVIRDILGTGLGGRPICNTDVFCFAPPEYPYRKLPQGTLHPKRVMKGVVSGVRDYGNKMGIPTVNGAILFDERFVGNPLVYCGTVGLIPKNRVHKKACKGDLIVVLGGRTGRDGIHGATFSSGELTHESETVSSGAVQIGDPIQEKKTLDALMQARDRGLYTAVTDCGAGGLSSAVGEMAQKLGAQVDLEKAPLKYEGLSYDEIWISESQERMVLAVHPSKLKALLKICKKENVEAAVIGTFTGSKRLELYFHGVCVTNLDMGFLHDGIPKTIKKAQWKPRRMHEPKLSCPRDLTDALHRSLHHLNICSKEWVIRQYDHEVQGASVIKPLCGIKADGPSDASVLQPDRKSSKGLAVANGINISYGKIDPFWMAVSCIDEAIRQIVASGGSLDRIAILDNFCWGNPDKPDRLGALVRASYGCLEASLKYKTPFISGKDSLNNEYTYQRKSISIPGTLLISAIGVVDDVDKCLTVDLKSPGNLIYLMGQTKNELGGSIYYDLHKLLGKNVPKVDFSQGIKIFRLIEKAVARGWLAAAHDCSDGGLAVALAEMAFSGDLGVTVFLKEVPFQGRSARNDTLLFSESNSRFVVEVKREHQKEFEKLCKNLPCGLIGCVDERNLFTVYGLDGKVCIQEKIEAFKTSWKRRLEW